jgi:arylsulfatase A-like enzyme
MKTMSRNDRPNILLITTDTQRCDTLRSMGSSFAVSPHLDRLAREGVLFKQAHTSSPVCGPARTCLLTGVHTPVHGCIENGVKPRLDLPIFPDLLKEQGYYNIMVGKTHFGPLPKAFDRTFTATEKNKDADDSYGRFIRERGYPRATSYPNPVPEELFMDAFLVDTTISEISKAVEEQENPFFAYCSLVSPHGPLDPPGQWANLFDQTPLPPLNYREGEIDRHPAHLRRLTGLMGEMQENLEHLLSSPEGRKEIDHQRKLYYGLAAYCDAQIGRLIDYLDTSGLRENTLIIFSSDHGTQLYDHGFSDKHNYYDDSWRIPLIMSMPGVLPQEETREFAIWNDITASILAAAGTGCDSMQGFDLFTPLTEGKPSPRRCAVASLYQSVAVATKHWKLEYYFPEGEGRLFNRSEDPCEQTDLFHHTDYAAVRHQLTEALLAWRAELTDLYYLKQHSQSGGPVAKRAFEQTFMMNGTDAEQRLNVRAEQIDAAFPGTPTAVIGGVR